MPLAELPAPDTLRLMDRYVSSPKEPFLPKVQPSINKRHGVISRELGRWSEQRLLAWFMSGEFSWVESVAQAPKQHPKYDLTLYLKPNHPVTQLLRKDCLNVDAKASECVANEYAKRHFSAHSQVIDWVRNPTLVIVAGPSWNEDDLRAQVVGQLLLIAGLFHTPNKFHRLLNHLPRRQYAAFLEEWSYSDGYADYLVFRSLSMYSHESA